MWTLNGESTLLRCLKSIAGAVPESEVCHRHLIDAGSTDATGDIARKFGWSVITARRRGIPWQANQALELVDTDVFASFEQDIDVNKIWYRTLMPKLSSDPSVAVVQGIRTASGSKYLEAIEGYGVRHGSLPPWVYSIDNNLYRTGAVRSVGGFPIEFPINTDGALRNNLYQRHWRWKVYDDVVSRHLRDSFPRYLKHIVLQTAARRVLWETYPEYPTSSKLSRFLVTPITAARMASESHTPGVFVGYPLLRSVKAISRVIGSVSKKYGIIEVRTQVQ